MQLTPDISILFQIAIFLCVWVGLKNLVFDPVQRVLAERDRRTVQAQQNAVELAGAAEADRTRYDEAVHQQRVRMQQEAERARHAAIDESNQQIAAVRAEITREIAHRRAEVAAQVEAARRTLAGEAQSIAAEMLARVLPGARA